ncbi:hypothetical protein [Azospirillum halopraeferens]|uniref:hypothetical protein n=1 Tax=Azospirillum halopraeferens TaxID=34010 RepID=UPI000415F9CD|nr:hypothetical protein [Azospirillum halopraeferens]
MGIVRIIVVAVVAALLAQSGAAWAVPPSWHDGHRIAPVQQDRGHGGHGDHGDCLGVPAHESGPVPAHDGAPPPGDHAGCCLAACIQPAVTAASGTVGPVAWDAAVLLPASGPDGRGRPVAPLRRPPKPAA